ncbi:ATP-binding protein [Streptomyces sp. 1331.2]|uniref:ATP-binding protein n=1 Tax=Streptomyces sp. 1331.2 TaxID=1938835 RepID=UPI000BD151DF|nr:ATP-binding protein [Streptomyces sp. 1331.2]SOB81584.1 Histidine kinase-like ATPase domain-containing protein [Streptomyces sp. 1331.2]
MPHPLLEAHAPPHASPVPVASLLLPYQPESVAAARRFVGAQLREWGLDDLSDDAAVIISELVTNACKTGCLTHMTVRLQCVTPRTIRISVRDGSRAMPVLLQADEADECHRGLGLVHKLTRGSWGIVPEACGKTVHASLRLT